MLVAICLINFGTYFNIVFIIKVRILVLIKWSNRSPQPWLLNLKWLAYSEHIVQFLILVSVLRSTPMIHIPFKYRCLNEIAMLKWGMSTLMLSLEWRTFDLFQVFYFFKKKNIVNKFLRRDNLITKKLETIR